LSTGGFSKTVNGFLTALTELVNEPFRKESAINDKCYALLQEKQNRIINAGFRVFSRC
jgi:hypothetical protein